MPLKPMKEMKGFLQGIDTNVAREEDRIRMSLRHRRDCHTSPGTATLRCFPRPIEKLPDFIVPSVTIIEVFKNVLRQRGEEAALIVIAHMKQDKVTSLDSALAMDAAECGMFYKLPLAESIIFATALKYAVVLWTQDRDLRACRMLDTLFRKADK
jgi:predicted nucleic acid-binding protein